VSQFEIKKFTSGVLIVAVIFGISYFIKLKQIKKSQIVKGVQSENLGLSPIELNSIPIKIGKVPVPQKSYYSALIDSESKILLDGKDENKIIPIASLTKIATALVVLDKYKIDDIVTVSENAQNVNGSKIFLQKGEKITIENLLNALLIMSANDAAIALSEFHTTTDEFISLMNAKAKSLGCNNTHFKDPAGLNDEGYSTAKEIGIIFAEAIKNPIISEIIHIPEKIISSDRRDYKLENSNRLVKNEMYLDGIIGGKTGFTPTSGHNLVVAAKRQDKTIIAVVIKTYNTLNTASAEAARDLINWGFDNWQWQNT